METWLEITLIDASSTNGGCNIGTCDVSIIQYAHFAYIKYIMELSMISNFVYYKIDCCDLFLDYEILMMFQFY